MLRSTPTPRRAYFAVPTTEDGALLHEQQEGGQNDTGSKSGGPGTPGNVPPTPSTMSFLMGEADYRDQGVIPRQTIFWALILSLSVVVILVLSGKDSTAMEMSMVDSGQGHEESSTPPHSHSHGAASLATKFPDFHEQCHEYYSFARPMDHTASYFGSGKHDIETMKEWAEVQEPGKCDTSLTYILTPGVGLFYHLNAIAQAYAFAFLDGRSFFIDDSEWDRGKWTDHFQPLPDQKCSPPSLDKMKGCPRGTRHWALDPMTLHYHFGHESDQEEFSNPRAANIWRRKPMFELSRLSFESILLPSDENARLIRMARESMNNITARTGGLYIGAHIRRGDRHPFSWFHHSDYIPIGEFVGKIQERWELARVTDTWLPEGATTFIASADPAFGQQLGSELPPTSDTMLLSTVSNEELSYISSTREYNQTLFSSLAPDERIRLTRGMIVDFDLLVGGWRLNDEAMEAGERAKVGKRHEIGDRRKKPIGVVCTLSSNICKMAAVALGWETAFEQNAWINVDGGSDFDWTPTEVP
ncbi:hypothetical protein T439DRAFT_43264 [Meredithblackwellia eburnea MCA 4105]